MTQLADETHVPPPSSHFSVQVWPSLILRGLHLGKSLLDVAQPSVAELRWFNAVGAGGAHCSGPCSAAGRRQKPHGGRL